VPTSVFSDPALPSLRARAIADGLVRTGRASNPILTQSFICLTGGNDVYYWVAFDGRRVLRGRRTLSADDLQAGFIESMVRAGSRMP
jgi:hypothetical protein